MEIYETQPERTDLPLVVMPVIIESMIEPFEKNFELLKDIARVRMYKDFTLDEDTIVERCAEADAIMVIGFHCADSILDRLNAKCYAFGGTGVASYIDLDKAKERGIRVCNVVHYGDHAVAEHTIALLMELARQVGKLDRQVKTGDWDGADGYEPEQVFADLNITPVNDMNELIAGSDVVSIHMPLLDSTKGIVTAENLEALKPGTMFINTARAEIIEPGALLARLQRGDIPAALDVFEHEPLTADDPLCSIPGIILTPHTAWRTDGAYVGITRQVVQSVAAFCKGEDFNVVV